MGTNNFIPSHKKSPSGNIAAHNPST